MDRAEVYAHVIPRGEHPATDGAERLAAVDRQVVVQLGARVKGLATDGARLDRRRRQRHQPCNTVTARELTGLGRRSRLAQARKTELDLGNVLCAISAPGIREIKAQLPMLNTPRARQSQVVFQ